MGKFIDLTGQKFNRLTVIERNMKKKGVYWNCECDCGSEKLIIVITASLKNGNTKSCGCLQKEKIKELNKTKIIDMTGKQFGKLTVISLTDKRTSTGNCIWLCQCECGNMHEVAQRNLGNEKTQSCGCIHKERRIKWGKEYGGKNYINIIGEIFGYLEVLERISEIKKYPEYKCKCLLCGNICQAKGKLLKNGHVLSCGCLKSFGEQQILDFLNKTNIKYKKGFRFPDCRGMSTEKTPQGNMLPFDFCIFNKNNSIYCIIEFDGKGHEEIVRWNGCSELQAKESFERTQRNDNIKNEYCSEKNINLIRIHYSKTKEVKNILEEILKPLMIE